MAAREYLDFEVEIGRGIGREYPVAIIHSPGGEARGNLKFPFDELALNSRLKDLQIALLRSGGVRRLALTQEENNVKAFGETLFDALITGEIRSRYDVSQREASRQGKGLRIKLRINPPELLSLPWEFLYDPRAAEYICLSTQTPLLRYIELAQVIPPLAVSPPLHILGVTASPGGFARLDVENEKLRVETALKELVERKQIDITWQEHVTWRTLQRTMRGGPWHILHFIGHGGFDRASDEGFVALEDENGELARLPATQLARLLADHTTLRLAVLNSCEGAQGSNVDIFSSTASLLVRRGLPAVLAMQYEITDRAAIEFSRGFYEALADGLPVDAATAGARISVSLGIANTIEWGTPVLFMRASDGVLFRPEEPWERAARREAERQKREQTRREAEAAKARIMAERQAREKTEQERLTHQREDAQRREKEEAERSGVQTTRTAIQGTAPETAEAGSHLLQDRILEAAIEKQVSVGVPAELFVWIKRLGSKSIIASIGEVDEDIQLDEGNVKAKGLQLEFPVVENRVLPAGISLRLTSEDFYPKTQQKKISVPPGGDSEICVFVITPRKSGQLLLVLEVLKEDTSLVVRTLRTTALESQRKQKSPRLLTSIPITVIVEHQENRFLSIGGDVKDSTVVFGDKNTVEEKTDERAVKEAERKAQEERLALEKAEAEIKAQQRAQAERLAREKAEAEKRARERAEAESMAREKAERKAAEKAELAEAERRRSSVKDQALPHSIPKRKPIALLFSVLAPLVLLVIYLMLQLPSANTDKVGFPFTGVTAGEVQVYRYYDENDQNPVQITQAGTHNWDPVSYTSARIYFTSDRSGKAEIYALVTQGKSAEVLQITTTPGEYESWSASVDSTGLLYFTSNRSGKAEIWALTDNGGLSQITSTPANYESWSPSVGSLGLLYFTSNRSGKAEIWALTDNGGLSQITSTPQNYESWSPVTKGQTIFYTSNRSGKKQIYLLTSQGQVTALSTLESWTEGIAAPIPSNHP